MTQKRIDRMQATKLRTIVVEKLPEDRAWRIGTVDSLKSAELRNRHKA